jgi:diadenosine tetraphosphatase ApaH/serine/threonine PP2A family protein phosphatase
MLDVFREVFNWLPLAFVLNRQVLVLHGGLFSKDGVTLDDLRKVQRNRCVQYNLYQMHVVVVVLRGEWW